MTVYRKTTKISPSQTAGEIQALLAEIGARRIIMDYEDGEITAIYFSVMHNKIELSYRFPINWQGCLEAMENDPKTPNNLCNEDQAKRVAFRHALMWLQAQAAYVQTNQVRLVEIMMPYLYNGTHTLCEIMEKSNYLIPEKT